MLTCHCFQAVDPLYFWIARFPLFTCISDIMESTILEHISRRNVTLCFQQYNSMPCTCPHGKRTVLPLHTRKSTSIACRCTPTEVDRSILVGTSESNSHASTSTCTRRVGILLAIASLSYPKQGQDAELDERGLVR